MSNNAAGMFTVALEKNKKSAMKALPMYDCNVSGVSQDQLNKAIRLLGNS